MAGNGPNPQIPPRDEALRADLRAFLAEYLAEIPLPRRARSWMGFDADFTRELGARGYIGLTLPKTYGGGGRSAFARFVVVEELLIAGAPVIAHWIADRQTAPCLLRFGTEEQRRRFIPPICRGELFSCIGMSEPDTGSDLASVRTRAERMNKGWRLNGRKIWTTNAHRSHVMLALVRTAGTREDRHKGLSQFLIDLSLPGISIRPIRDLAGDDHFSEVLFDDVLLPDDALVGREGAGWEQVNAELAFERSGPERFLSSMILADQWLAHLRSVSRADAYAEQIVGRIASRLAALRTLSLAVTAKLDQGESPLGDAAIVKDLGTSFEQWLPEAIANVIGSAPDEPAPHTLLQTLAYMQSMSPSFSLRGGTREILRGMIARDAGLR
ncbi:acyl-CoA dehydrogenase family protein [Ferrovibrio sp.]|uniref:acyl-CoA dehydrogenase family protein n=1 Tax=Ferrovibrio sp. TaxID=1917215 RepID=UPI0035AE9BB7